MTKICPNKPLKTPKTVLKFGRLRLIKFFQVFLILTTIVGSIQCSDLFSLPPGFLFTGIHGEFGGAPEPPPTIIVLRGPRPHYWTPRTSLVFVKPEWKFPWWPIHNKKTEVGI